MNCYATLFITWLIADNGYFEELLKRDLWPEVGLQHGGFDFSLRRHKEVAAKIKGQGLRCSVHLPFYEVRAGSAKPGHRRKSLDILMRALEICALYEPDHLIGHPEFRPGIDSVNSIYNKSLETPDKNKPSEVWLERSAEAWGEVLKNSPARLYLENTSDFSPEALMGLLKFLPLKAALCFDVGHWYYAAQGSVKKNLSDWVVAIAPRLEHLHLHDNDGESDQHLGIGFGGIDYGDLMRLLKDKGLRPTFTLEAHHLVDLTRSQAFLRALPPEAPLKGLAG